MARETFTVRAGREVLEIEVALVAEKFDGEVSFTDVHLQAGRADTLWMPHPGELRWTWDG